MDNKPYITRINKLSNHGTKEGIIPRFVLQMLELEKQAYMPLGNFKKSHNYINIVITDFTTFYDLHQSILKGKKEYIQKLLKKELIEIQNNNIVTIDRTTEVDLIQNVKDFFIKGRILINNWGKSEVIKDDFIDLKNLLIVKDSNFLNQQKKYLTSDKIKRYEYIFKLIQDRRSLFLNKFNNIRAKLEHESLEINHFQIDLINDEVRISEPLLDNEPMYELIDFFYKSILDLIEKVMVYYFGINAVINWNGIMNLFKREEFDFERQLYEFVILPNQERNKMKRLINF